MHFTIPSAVFSIPKLVKRCYVFFEKRTLEKEIQPFRAAACKSPSQVAWTADPGTEHHRLFERMVKVNLMVRSPLFPNQYMLPTRWR